MDEIKTSDADTLRSILVAVLRKTGPIEVSNLEFGEATMAVLQRTTLVGTEEIDKGARFGLVER